MHITGIRITNYGIIKDLDLAPDSRLNFIVGKNKQGKTTILKAIKDGLIEGIDPSMIRNGADKAEILIDLQGLQTDRIRTKKSERFTVKTETTLPTGETQMTPLASPQTIMGNLVGDFSFDPLHFVSLQPKDRAKYLREIFKTKVTPGHLSFIPAEELRGIDYDREGMDILGELERRYYTRRSDINKTVARKKALYEESKAKTDAYTVPPSFVDLSAKIMMQLEDVDRRISDARTLKRQAEGTQALRDKKQANIDANKKWLEENPSQEDRVLSWHKRVNQIEAQIRLLQEEQKDLQRAIADFETTETERSLRLKAIADDESTIAALPKVEDVPDIAVLEEEKRGIEHSLADNNRLTSEKAEIDYTLHMEIEYLAEKDASDKLTTIIDKLRKDLPAQITAEANIPIPNLRIEGEQIWVGDTSVDNMSTSEQISFAIGIVKALNQGKKLKVLCLDRSESLDDDTLREFGRQIQQDPDEFQFWITIVTNKDEQTGKFNKKIPTGSSIIEMSDGGASLFIQEEEVPA